MKHFTKNNQSFTCDHCSAIVPEHPTSSRDHCNHCLWGKHVDIYPGDRANDCRGMLQPIELEIKNGKTKIVYQCQKCAKTTKNIIAVDDDPDSIRKLIRLVNY